MSLTDFLLARIAEDEAERVIPEGDPGWPFTRSAEELAESERWKAECEAKRRIMEEHSPHEADPWSCRTCSAYESCGCLNGPAFPCPTLRFLALPYADHPDYREEWKP